MTEYAMSRRHVIAMLLTGLIGSSCQKMPTSGDEPANDDHTPSIQTLGQKDREMKSVPPAVVEFQAECKRRNDGFCKLSDDGAGWDVGFLRWTDGIEHAIDLINRIPDKNELAIWETPLNDAEIARFQNLEGLRKLEFNRVPWSGAALDKLDSCRDVEHLESVWCPIDGKSLSGLRHFKGVKTLDIRDVKHNPDDALLHMRHLTQLEGLSFSTQDSSFTGDGFKGLSMLQNLRTIDMFHARVSRGFGHLSQCPKLEMLELSDTLLDDDGLKEIAMIHGLRELYVSSPHITDFGIMHLRSLRHLQTICCTGDLATGESQVTEKSLEVLKHLNEIREVVTRFPITDYGVRQLEMANKMTFFSLDRSVVSPKIIHKLESMYGKGVVSYYSGRVN